MAVRHRLKYAIWLLVLAACNSSSSPAVSPKNGAASTPTAASADVKPLEADPREPLLSQAVINLLESDHLRQRRIDDAVSRAAFSEYLDRLDPGKMFLLQEHVEMLEEHADLIDDQMRDGDLQLARFAAALMAQRQATVAKVVEGRLGSPFDYTKDEEFETDSSKLEFAASEEELAERWRKALKLEALERIHRMEETARAMKEGSDDDSKESGGPTPNDPTAEDEAEARVPRPQDIPDTAEGREKKARADLATSYDARFSRLADVESLEAAADLLNAVASIYDPHTIYLPPADRADFDIEMSGSLEGIGALLAEEDHYIVVRELVPGGASWRQGELEPGDLILAVAQEDEEPVDVVDMRINKVVQMIRGPKGTEVQLTVKKPDDTVEIISITRDVVEIEAAYARGALLDAGDGKDPVGYVYLPSFYGETGPRKGAGAERNAPDDVRKILERLEKRDVSGIIIDLRANGGGLLDHARTITGLFIETGPVVQTRYSSGEHQVLKDDDPDVAFRGDVVVLVDRFSASASEILASALQDYRRAVVVGTGPTHGKGTVQVLVDLDRLRSQQGDSLGVLKLTIQQFFGIDGGSNQWRGVIPDIILPDPFAHLETGERYLDNAIEWSKIDPLDFDTWKTSWDIVALTKKSDARRAEQEAFAKVKARSKLLKDRRDETRVPLNREAWLAKREADREALKDVDPELTEGPARFELTMIDYAGKKTPPRGGKDRSAEDPLARWKKELTRDPWVEEAIHILGDIGAGKRQAQSDP